MRFLVVASTVCLACGLLAPPLASGLEGGSLPELIFVQDRGECSELRVMRSDGTHARRLRRCGFGVQSPDWSPDGRLVVFVDSKDGGPGLYVMRADGTATHRIVPGDPRAGEPAWSPDGRMIAYSSGRSLLVSRADGTGRRRIARAGLELDGPRWSPDGRRIVYAGSGVLDNDTDLYLVTVATKRVVRLTRTVGSAVSPAWSPNGRTIAFVRLPPNAPQGALQVVRPDGSGRRTLLRESVYRHPAWSSDGKRIAIVRGGEPLSAAEIFTVSANGDDLRRVTRNRFDDSEPDWRP